MGIVVRIPGAFIFALYGMGRKKTADRAAESD
jgi:hypothetical protein